MVDRDSDPSTGQYDRNNHVFQIEYRYWRGQGHAHIVAQRKAIDYYRKFLKREVTVNWEFLADNHQIELNDHPEDSLEHIQFNTVVRHAMFQLTARQRELLSYIILQQELESHLDEDTLTLVIRLTKGRRPGDIKEMAGFMGLALNGIGVCTPITAMRKRISLIFAENGFTLGAT